MKSSLLPLLAFALLAGCAKHAAPEPAGTSLPVVRVSTARVEDSETPLFTEVPGTIRPARRAQVAPKVMGAIAELPVVLGQQVAAGELLARISAAEITARVAQARAQFNVARRDLARERDLLAKGASTQDLVQGLEDRFAMLEAMVREAETMLGYTEIRAPFAGVIARRYANVGDLAAPGQPLLELEGAADFQIEAGVPDSLVAGLAIGQALSVSGAAGFAATIAEISSSSDAHARTVTVKLAVPADAPVRSGQFVRVLVPAGQARTLLVPADAVSLAGQMERIFGVQDGRAVLRLVKTGARHGGRVEILSGLGAGETVVAPSVAGLREGQPVEITP